MDGKLKNSLLDLGERIVLAVDGAANALTEEGETLGLAAAPGWVKFVGALVGPALTSELEALEHKELMRLAAWLHGKRETLAVPPEKVEEFEAKPVSERLAAVKAATGV